MDSLSAPYNPAVSKPMHIVWEHYDSTAMETFYAKIYGQPAQYSATCLLGREGFNDSDWVIAVDNSGDDCAAKMQTVNVLAVANSNSHGVATHSVHVSSIHWVMMISIVAVALLFFVWRRRPRPSKIVVDTQSEFQPLLFQREDI